MTLLISGDEAASIFRLNGADENSATYALGWALQHSRHFLSAMLSDWFGEAADAGEVVVSLQKHGVDGGFTDVEVLGGDRFHVIIEAKKHWNLPSVGQLSRYRPRLATSVAGEQLLVSISSADADLARRRLPVSVDGVAVVHQSWSDIQRLARKAHADASGYEEKLWLRHFIQHLKEFVAMDRVNSNLVYVVSLGLDPMVQGGAHTWVDVVEKDRCYFHPVGDTWPHQPPNYMGFRHHGKLQSVHHVDNFVIVDDLSQVNPLWPASDRDHFVYRLGPPMLPPKEMRTGPSIVRSARAQCAIDTLLSGQFETISDAKAETKRRLGEER